MNDIGPMGDETRAGAVDYRDEMDACVRRHPESAILAALLGGLFIGLLFLILRPERSARSRASRLFGGMQDQVRDFASSGMKRVMKTANRGEGKMERAIRGATRRWKRFVS